MPWGDPIGGGLSLSLRKPLFMDPTEGFHEELSLTSGDVLNVSGITLPPAGSGGLGIDMGDNKVFNMSTPTDGADAATKEYVDAIARGLDPHEAVRAKTACKLGSQARRVGSGGTGYTGLVQNDTITITLDGGTPDVITIGATPPTTLAGLITEINTQYGSTVAYAGATNQIDLRSASFLGVNSIVAVSAITGNWNTEAGITAGSTTGAVFVAAGTGGSHTLESPVVGAFMNGCIDGITLLADERVLVTWQGGGDSTVHLDNGLYMVATLGDVAAKLKLQRVADCDTVAAGELWSGCYAWVTDGLTLKDTGWSEVTDLTGLTIDVDATNKWGQVSGAASYTYDQGLIKNISSIQVDLDSGADLQGAGAPTLARKSGLEFSADTSGGKLRVAVAPNGGLQRYQTTPFGLEIKLYAPGAVNTLALDGSGGGLSVLGVPDLFTIGTTATSQTPGTGVVTAANLNTLTAGATSDADALHTHPAITPDSAERVEIPMDGTGGSVGVGDPVYISASEKINEADTTDAKAKVIGVARDVTTISAIKVVVAGVAVGVLSGAAPGAPYYLATGGGLTTALPGAGKRVIQCGMAWKNTDLFVRIVDFGKKAA